MELEWLADQTDSAAAIALAQLEVPGTDDTFWIAITAMLSTAGNMSKILWPPSTRPYAQNRARHLRDLLLIQDDSILKLRDVRNKLEHYDERLDDWSKRADRGELISLVDGIFQCGVDGLSPSLDGLSPGELGRIYTKSTGVLSIFGSAVQLSDLLLEIQRIRSTARTLLKRGEGPEGYVRLPNGPHA